MKKWLIAAVGALILVQLLVPAYLIAGHYDVLKNGTEYKFRVEPVDPYDAFRGRFVYIRARGAQKELYLYGEDSRRPRTQYAGLAVDGDGFAYITEVSDVRNPAQGAYAKGKSSYSRFTLPIERYYMDETLAPLAEKQLRPDAKAGKDGYVDAYVTVRIKDGRCVVSGLYVDGVRIEDYLKALQN